MKVRQLMITPDYARDLLKMNSANRPLRQKWVQTLTGIIKRGEWQVTHQGLAITKEGHLIDGQHRLQAVVSANTSVPMQVWFDVDQSTFIAVDNGIKRTVGDQIGVDARVVSVARMTNFLLENYKVRNSLTPKQIADILSWAENPIVQIRNMARKTGKMTSAPILFGATVQLMNGNLDAIRLMIAMNGADFDNMPPSVRALCSQIVRGETNANGNGVWDLAARTYRAMTPKMYPITKLLVRDLDNRMNEMKGVVLAYRANHTEQLQDVA